MVRVEIEDERVGVHGGVAARQLADDGPGLAVEQPRRDIHRRVVKATRTSVSSMAAWPSLGSRCRKPDAGWASVQTRIVEPAVD